MDFQAISAVESGAVEIVEFSWPVATQDQITYQCLAYCVMKRPSGLLLCVPEGFLATEQLDQGGLSDRSPRCRRVCPLIQDERHRSSFLFG